jgi:hypothetical protein
MEIGEWKATAGLNERYREAHALGLAEHLAELDSFGFTVVPPEVVGPPELTERLQAALLTTIEGRTGSRPDPATGHTYAPDAQVRPNEEHFWLIFEDQVFEEALMNPVGLMLVSHLLGDSCVLSISSGLVKGETDRPLFLHCDLGAPDPFPDYEQTCNVTWLLTDYTLENGALCFVPGSHRWRRHPMPKERMDFDLAVPIEAPRGSLVVWGGSLWHGAFPRTVPGLRMAVINVFVRPHLRSVMPFQDRVPQAALDRNPARFATIMGQGLFHGFAAEGPDPAKQHLMPRNRYG